MPEARSEAATLWVAGARFEGWQDVRVRRGMEHCAGSFELEVSELWPGQDYTRRLQPGEPCQVLLGGDAVVSGYVDEVDLDIDARTHTVKIGGRDKTADLVDCAALHKPGQWRGFRIERIAQDIAAPFGVEVMADVDTGNPLATFALQEGETAFAAIERAARIRALLLMTDGAGRLLITRTDRQRSATVLQLGRNLLAGRARQDVRDRFRDYVVKGQAPGSDFTNGAQVAQMRALAIDPGVLRYRPYLVTADTPDLAAGLAPRARWEASVRAARSMQVDLTVQGWRDDAGALWEPNTLVRVVAEPLRLDAELLLAAVEYRQGEAGTTCRLSLTRPDAFAELGVAAPAPAAPASEWWNVPKRANG